MEALADRAGPSLPIAALIVGTILTGVLVLLAIIRLKNPHGAYVLGATWFRYIMSAFHSFSYSNIGPFSIIALSTIVLFLIGLMLLRPRLLALNFLIPIYVMCAVVILSGVVNGQYVGLMNVLVKYGFLLVIILATYEALLATPPGKFFRLYLFAFLPLTVFQILGMALGVTKAVVKNGENDGAIAHIGGFDHEATFTVMLATMFVAAIFTTKINPFMKIGFILAALGGIYMANYRTTLLALAPAIAVFAGLMPVNQFRQRDRPFATAVLILMVCVVVGIATLALGDRYSDISTIFTHGADLIKPGSQYTDEESRILSGRPHIWADYIGAWMQGGDVQHLLGFGPESWALQFPFYAHNTLVCMLYEYGVVGVVAMLALWISMLVAALRIRLPQRNIVIGVHVSFLVLNMATQPLWMVEGNILYGLLCGYTLYLLKIQRVKVRAPSLTPVLAPSKA